MLEHAIAQAWYQGKWYCQLLRPLSWLYGSIMGLRRFLYKHGIFNSTKFPVPIIIVGNLTVGGVGKTPFVIWLTNALKNSGYKPGIVSRGYGGKALNYPCTVSADSDPAEVGDEPVLLSSRSLCPVVVAPNRVSAVKQLLQEFSCDIIVCDDGLQHYALKRDLEIAIIDGERELGNGLLLPAGPLREPKSRLNEVDWIIYHDKQKGKYRFHLEGAYCVNLLDSTKRIALQKITTNHDIPIKTVHAVAAIGHPERFFNFLRSLGLEVIVHGFPDHHRFTQSDLSFTDGLPVIMTEKDAVKCKHIAKQHFWYIPVDAVVCEPLYEEIINVIGLT